jgi:hypothetical protein
VKSTYIAGEFRGGLGGLDEVGDVAGRDNVRALGAARARRCNLQWRSSAAGEGVVRPEGEGCSERAQSEGDECVWIAGCEPPEEAVSERRERDACAKQQLSGRRIKPKR